MADASGQASEELRELLQERLALFGKILFGIGAVGFLLTIPGAFIGDGLHAEVLALLVLAPGSAGALYLYCRGATRTEKQLRIAEATALTVDTIAVTIMARFLVAMTLDQVRALGPIDGEPGHVLDSFFIASELHVLMTLSLGMTHTFVLRAALVPSPPRYTAILTTLVAIPLGAFAVFALLPLPIEETIGTPADVRPLIFIQVVVWWLFTVVVCTVISAVIYGLRKEIREAQKLGQYTLEGKIGEGGMGEVYRARHALMRRPTAIKLLPKERAGERSIRRFEKEVRLTAMLSHPNTITIYDYGHTPDGIFYYAMELLDGGHLEDIVAVDGPQPPERVAKILLQVADALTEAHEIGLIHRDVKPTNVFLCERGGIPDVAKLLDFGLVKERESKESIAVSQEGSITGTPMYMAPELLTSPDTVDGRVDLYSLGAIGWFLLTGKHVFTGKTAVEVLGHHLHTVPPRPSSAAKHEVPEALENILMQCLEKDPEARPESAAALVRLLSDTGLPQQWSRDRAQQWWDDIRDGLSRRTMRLYKLENRTMEIDVEQRSQT